MKPVFVAGSTGYMGRRLVQSLTARGHRVRALVRPASLSRAPEGCEVVAGDALDGATFAAAVQPGGTFVQLVGVSHPSPAKARQFRTVDLVSTRASLQAAVAAGVTHFIYVSVAQPAPVMKAYQAARGEAEEAITASGLTATIVRPWYVLGPGHRWPLMLLPLYALLDRLPATRPSSLRLGLVTIDQMVQALVHAVEHPPAGIRIVDVPGIRAAGPDESAR